jgi:hypothetical protein
MTKSILDYEPGFLEIEPFVNGLEPTLRMLVHQYYAKHFAGSGKANEYARRYCEQIEEFEKINGKS